MSSYFFYAANIVHFGDKINFVLPIFIFNFVTAVTVTGVTKIKCMRFYNRTSELAELQRLQNLSDYTNEDLLALYAFTGGVPKYVELFCDNTALGLDEMIAFMVRENSPFTDEGKNLLIEEFGKNYAFFFYSKRYFRRN